MGAAAAKHGEETATRRTTYALPRVFVACSLVTSRDERGTWRRLRLGLLQIMQKQVRVFGVFWGAILPNRLW